MLFSSHNQALKQIIQNDIDPEEIEDTRSYFTQNAVNEQGWYDRVGILASLFDLYLENYSTDKPIIHLDLQDIVGAERKGLYDEFMEISKLQSEKNRDVLYIRKRPTNTPGTRSGTTEDHWIVFYFFTDNGGQKNLLLVDTLYVESRLEQFKIDAKDFLQNENYNLYVSTTKIQQDKCSCGPIASEITRMLYSNHESVKALLFKIGERGNNIELSSFLPEHESQQLFGSCVEDGIVNYGIGDEVIRAADFRVAHFVIALTFGIDNILSKLHNESYYVNECVQEKFKNAKQIVANIRSIFIDKPSNVTLFNKEIEKLCQKRTHTFVEETKEELPTNQEISRTSNLHNQANQNKHKNIQYGKSALYFTIAVALSALIITAAFLTQTYIILAALIIPAMIGLYGYNEGQKPDSKLQGDIELKNISIHATLKFLYC